MTAKYFAILTNYGAAQLANAVALGTQMNISKMAVGDGGGTLPVPDPAQTKLVRETRRAAVNQVSVDEKNPNFIIAEQVIPENEGGWFIREIGLFDDNGGLIAVGNAPETYKPNLQEGSGRTQIIQMVLMVSSTQAITLKVDPSVVLATREYVTKSIDAAIQASEARAAKTYQPIGDYVLHPYLKLELLKKVDKADIAQQLGNDTGKVVSQNLLTAELGKKASVADANSKLAKDQNGADIPNKDTFIKNLGLPEKYQPIGSYADKASALPQEFKSSIRATGVDAVSGSSSLGLRVSDDGYYLNLFDGKDYRRIYLPFKAGEIPLKAEVDAELAKKGNKNTALNAENGWWKCGDTGRMRITGRAVGKNGDVIYFPVPFVSDIYSVVLVDCKGNQKIGVTSRTPYGFSLATDGATVEFNYIAEGR